MLALVIFAALAAPAFWEVKAPSGWTDEEVKQLLTNSSWAQTAAAPREEGGMVVYLATARPAREAEEELRRRDARLRSIEDPTAHEYREFLRENAGRVIVLAVRFPSALTDDAEVHRMEKDCVLKVGRRKYRLMGHFPPTPSDPFLRLVFPREVNPEDRTLRFELYVPGVSSPLRWAEFRLKELKYKGALEF